MAVMSTRGTRGHGMLPAMGPSGPTRSWWGAGHNGLVAANLLADAGWDVLVLEATAHIGGAVASSSAHPGGGVHGGPGANAARAALARDRALSGDGYAAVVRLAHRHLYG
jgi:NADPH-dependent glutamate synthase beta subunit-like oxidoreductase